MANEKNKNIDKSLYAEEGTKGFKKGNPGGGRPVGQKNYLTLLEEALEREAKRAGVTYWEKLAQWSFTNPSMAASILKKFVPDREHKEIELPEPIRGTFEVIHGNNKDNGDIPVADREQGKD